MVLEGVTLMKPHLEACPFCGSSDVGLFGAVMFYGQCRSCGASGGTGESAKEGANLWNMRGGVIHADNSKEPETDHKPL